MSGGIDPLVEALGLSPDQDEKRQKKFRDFMERLPRQTCAPACDPVENPAPMNMEKVLSGMFLDHSCWKCQDGKKPCVRGAPHQCEYPHARND